MPFAHQLDWTTTQTNVNAAAATGANATIKASLLATLQRAGAAYDARYDGTCETAKAAWLAAAELAHNNALQATRYAESLGAGDGGALAFDEVKPDAILARLTAAQKTASASVASILAAHGSAVSLAVRGDSSTNAYAADVTRTIRAIGLAAVQRAAAAKAKGDTTQINIIASLEGTTTEALLAAVDAYQKNGTIPHARTVVDAIAVRTLETTLRGAIADCVAWLAAVAFV